MLSAKHIADVARIQLGSPGTFPLPHYQHTSASLSPHQKQHNGSEDDRTYYKGYSGCRARWRRLLDGASDPRRGWTEGCCILVRARVPRSQNGKWGEVQYPRHDGRPQDSSVWDARSCDE